MQYIEHVFDVTARLRQSWDAEPAQSNHGGAVAHRHWRGGSITFSDYTDPLGHWLFAITQQLGHGCGHTTCHQRETLAASEG
jgi:hypothetical protein